MSETLLRIADVEIDLLTRRVKRGEKLLSLPPREFRLLEFLTRNVGKVQDRPTLLRTVWDCHFDPRTNVVESHISRLRAKIDRGFDVPSDPHDSRRRLLHPRTRLILQVGSILHCGWPQRASTARRSRIGGNTSLFQSAPCAS